MLLLCCAERISAWVCPRIRPRSTYTQNIGPSSGLGANYDNTGLGALACAASTTPCVSALTCFPPAHFSRLSTLPLSTRSLESLALSDLPISLPPSPSLPTRPLLSACQCSNQDIALGLSGCANLPQAYTGSADALAVSLGYPQHLAGGNMTCPVMNNAMASQYHNYKLVRLFHCIAFCCVFVVFSEPCVCGGGCGV